MKFAAETKWCNRCGREKPLKGNFYRQVRWRKAWGVFDYYRPSCIGCQRKNNLARYYERRAERVAA